MQEIRDQYFDGERPLFGSHGLKLVNVTIGPGESSIKEGSDITAENCVFGGKYPLWHIDGAKINDCTFKLGARAAVWYTKDISMSHTLIEAPKMFRETDGIRLDDVKFEDAAETMWFCRNIGINSCDIKNGDYLCMHSENIQACNLILDGNYSFQACKNVTIKNSVLNARDAFWESSNVTVIDSQINGEFLGWHSRKLRLVNCKISGTQPLCYAEDLILENCIMDKDCDLAFEYSSVNASVNSVITSVKNPLSGKIMAKGYNEIINDRYAKAPNDCFIGILQ